MPSKPKHKTICYYISGHGYGHAARASQVMAALPPDVKIIVRSEVDPAFFIRESGRHVEVIRGKFDTGVLQHNNRSLDWEGTFKLARKVNRDASANLMAETDFLRKRRVDLIVCDVPPAPLEAARMAGIPSAFVGNFTWVEIFEKEGRTRKPAKELSDFWRDQYRLATLAIRTPPAFPMTYFRSLTTVQPIARRGKNRRKEILRFLGAAPDSRLVLMYFGTFGDDELRLPDLPNTVLLAFTKVPEPGVTLDPQQWHFPDVVASVDCVIAKPGYGTTGECMANGTPMIYHPRMEFAEYPVLRKAINEWNGGIQISLRNLTQGTWSAAIEKAIALKPKRVASNGARQTADLLMGLLE